MSVSFIGDTGCTVGTGRTEISLSGTAITSPDTHRTFASGLTNGEWVTVTVSKSAGNVSTVTGQYTTGTPNKLTSLTWSDELGTISAADTVDCIVIDGGLVHVVHNSDANLNCYPGALYLVDASVFTANRNAVFKAPAQAGQRFGIVITAGNSAYSLILVGDTGISIDDSGAATERTRLLITNESWEVESSSTTQWRTTEDGRKSPYSVITNTATRQQSIANNTWATLLGSGASYCLDNIVSQSGVTWTASAGEFTILRAGLYKVGVIFNCPNGAAYNGYCGCFINSTTRYIVSPASEGRGGGGVILLSLSVGDTVEAQVVQSSGGPLNTNTSAGEGAVFSIFYLGDG